jgi:hypothetical protein
MFRVSVGRGVSFRLTALFVWLVYDTIRYDTIHTRTIYTMASTVYVVTIVWDGTNNSFCSYSAPQPQPVVEEWWPTGGYFCSYNKEVRTADHETELLIASAGVFPPGRRESEDILATEGIGCIRLHARGLPHVEDAFAKRASKEKEEKGESLGYYTAAHGVELS